MPKKKHLHHVYKRRTSNLQGGFISSEGRGPMSRNEKIIMGAFIGGILLFLLLSVVLLFNKAEKNTSTDIVSSATPTPAPSISPYPTIPPIKDMTIMINERRLNPPVVTIKAGNSVDFFNIGENAAVIEQDNPESSILNFSVQPSEARKIQFTNKGAYIFRIRGTNLLGRITVE